MVKRTCGKLLIVAGLCGSLTGGGAFAADRPASRPARPKAVVVRSAKPPGWERFPPAESSVIRLVSGSDPIEADNRDASETPDPGPDLPDPPISRIAPRERTPIDLRSALALAGVQNLELVVAQQRVEAAVADQQLAAAQILPSLNAGTNYDNHMGVVQQASGNILAVNRSSLYVGAGVGAVAAGTVSIPGVQYNLNISESIYRYLVGRKLTEVRRLEQFAIQNETLLKVARAYVELLRAEAVLSVAILTRSDAREVARLTANYAKTGEGRQADADRAATELARRQEEVVTAQAAEGNASRRLCELLNLDMTIALAAVESQFVPQSIVPPTIPLPELLAIALLDRPELRARRTAVQGALLELDSAKVLPFSPQMLFGFSGGSFGGGSNLASGPQSQQFGVSPPAARFGDFAGRTDVDLVLYWSLRNLGLGNKAMIDIARARVRSSEFEELVVFDRVRKEVADAYYRSSARFAEIDRRSKGVVTGSAALREDMSRVRGREGLPIELLDSLRQLARSRNDYVEAIVAYDEAQFDLYVALGNPPADMLARPVPKDFPEPDFPGNE